MFTSKIINDFQPRNDLKPIDLSVITPVKMYSATTYTHDKFAKPNHHIVTLGVNKGVSCVYTNPRETLEDPRVFNGNKYNLPNDSKISTLFHGGIFSFAPHAPPQKIESANFPIKKAKL